MKSTMLSLAVVVILLASTRMSFAGSTTESFVTGSIAGGTTSITVGQIQHYGPPPPFPHFFIRPPNYHPKHYRQYRKYTPRYDRDCRIVQHHTYRYGQRYTTTERICRDDRDYRDRRYRDWDRRDWKYRDHRDKREWDHRDRRDRHWDRDDYRHDWRGDKRSQHGDRRVWQ